jgi:hypothetical protein
MYRYEPGLLVLSQRATFFMFFFMFLVPCWRPPPPTVSYTTKRYTVSLFYMCACVHCVLQGDGAAGWYCEYLVVAEDLVNSLAEKFTVPLQVRPP